MDADAESNRQPGSFRELAERLLREGFPTKESAEVERYLDRAMDRVHRAGGRPQPNPEGTSSGNDTTEVLIRPNFKKGRGASQVAEESQPSEWSNMSLDELVRVLALNSLRNRLEFRTHTAIPSHARLACGCIRVRTRILDAASEELARLKRALETAGEVNFTARRANRVAFSMVDEIDSLVIEASALHEPFIDDLQIIKARVQDVVHALDEGNIDGRERHLAGSLAARLDDLERVMNDFSGADFTEVDLEGVRLEGVRWSTQTIWPTAWSERITRASTEIGPGIFLITADNPEFLGPTAIP